MELDEKRRFDGGGGDDGGDDGGDNGGDTPETVYLLTFLKIILFKKNER